MGGDSTMSSTVLTKPDTKKLKLARQIREARKRGEESLKHDPRASFAKYENGRVTVGLTSGWSFSFDPRIYRGLKDASDEELADVSVLGFGFVLEWEKIDQHLGVGSLVLDLLGEKFLNAESARRLGEVTSERKKAASRTNGKLGGRPRKKA
jgi:Protein of unknown function (DUF2442)